MSIDIDKLVEDAKARLANDLDIDVQVAHRDVRNKVHALRVSRQMSDSVSGDSFLTSIADSVASWSLIARGSLVHRMYARQH